MASFWLNWLGSPLSYVLDPSQRLFAGSLCSALILASWLYLRQATSSPPSWKGWREFLFSRKVWLHRSALLDYQLFFFNAWLKGLCLPVLISPLLLAMMGTRWMLETLGDPFVFKLEGWQIAGLFALVMFLVEDWSRYQLHRWMHRVSWLWEIHQLHHSAEVLTPWTLHRVHPAEMLLGMLRHWLVFAGVLSLFFYCFGPRIPFWQILGVDALGLLFNHLGANLRHSPVWWSFGRWERVFLSPAQHQIHHSAAPEHMNKNFGVCLAFWDAWNGSLYCPARPETLRFGLSGEPAPPIHHLGKSLWQPVYSIFLIFLQRFRCFIHLF